jgi:predicted AAA+ superfamily ATPase
LRPAGKTTLLRHLYGLTPSKNKAFFDFENSLETKVFEEENFNAIWDNLANYGVNKGKKAYIFIDEIQNLPIISRVVKYLYDHYETKFFLTGSSSFYLKNLFPESLAGRKFVFELFPPSDTSACLPNRD